jgi:hypothetical protein
MVHGSEIERWQTTWRLAASTVALSSMSVTTSWPRNPADRLTALECAP